MGFAKRLYLRYEKVDKRAGRPDYRHIRLQSKPPTTYKPITKALKTNNYSNNQLPFLSPRKRALRR